VRSHVSRGRPALGWRAVLILFSLVLAACGSRLSAEEIVAQNGGGATRSADQQSAGGTGPGTAGADGVATLDGTPATTPAVAGTPGSAGGPGEAGAPTGDAVAAGAAAGPSTPGETGPVVIGLVGTLSGPAGALNAPMAQGVQVWADMINQRGGLFGRPVQVVRVDDGGDPSRHVAAVRDLVENRKVVAFVGNVTQFALDSARGYLESKQVPLIGAGCDVEGMETSDIFFSQCPPFAALVENIFRAQAKFGEGRKLAVIYCNEAEPCRTGRRLAEERAPAAGIQVVYSAGTSLAQPDFTSECINARDRGADVLFMSTDPNSAIRIADNCARQGYRPAIVAGPNTSPLANQNRGLENMLLALPTFPFVGKQTPAAAEFEDVFAAATGDVPGPYAAEGWVAAKLFELAATKAAAAAQSVSSKTLIDALYTVENETLGGLSVPLTFKRGGGVENASCYWAVRSTDGQWGALNGPEPICN
jgi:branched-chain amino acid transport system substrate-binding protein